MERPFKEVRPIGPFAQTTHSIAFKSMYSVSQLDAVGMSTIEDNLQDKLMAEFDEVLDLSVSSSSGSDELNVTVMYGGSEITSSMEDSMLSSIKTELNRLTDGTVRELDYKYVL